MVVCEVTGGWNSNSESSDENLDDHKPNSRDFTNLFHITNVDTQGYMDISPITEVIAVRAMENPNIKELKPTKYANRYKNLKSLWVAAMIQKQNVDKGEPTNSFEDLRNAIRSRGKLNEDACGHIVARCLGGKMIDINLFPQNTSLNSGHKKTHLLWRAIEILMKTWITIIPQKYKPRVLFRIKLIYHDQNHVDRPNLFHYKIKFLADDDEKADNEEGNDNKCICICQALSNCIPTVFEYRAEDLDIIQTQVRNKIKEMLKKCQKGTQCTMNIDKFVQELSSHVNIFLTKTARRTKAVQMKYFLRFSATRDAIMTMKNSRCEGQGVRYEQSSR